MTDDYKQISSEAIVSLSHDMKGLLTKVAYLEAGLTTVEAEIRQLRKVVMEGNGQESILSKLTRVDERVNGLLQSLHSSRVDLESFRKDNTKELDEISSKVTELIHKSHQTTAATIHSGGAPITSPVAPPPSGLSTPVLGIEVWKLIISAAVTLGLTALTLMLGGDDKNNPQPNPSPTVEQRAKSN